MTPDLLASLASQAYGSDWKSALARELNINPRSVQRWVRDGIGKPDTARAIEAYLRSRRVVHLPPPPDEDADQDRRDDAAHDAMRDVVAELIEAGEAIGWHPAEITAALLANVVETMIEGAGAPAAAETLRELLDEVRGRVAR